MKKEHLERASTLDFHIRQLEIQMDYVKNQLANTTLEEGEFRYYLENHMVGLVIGKKEIKHYLNILEQELAKLKEEFENL